jgi:mono/diheme cytochrome c family protein
MNIALRFAKKVTHLLLLAALLLLVQSISLAQDSSATGADKIKAKFKSACASCHAQDGSGTPLGKSMNAPDLRSPEVQKLSDAELTKAISDGKGDMPAFKKSFTPEQVQALVKHVRGLAGQTERQEK